MQRFRAVAVEVGEVGILVAGEREAEHFDASMDAHHGDALRPSDRVQFDHQILVRNPA